MNYRIRQIASTRDECEALENWITEAPLELVKVVEPDLKELSAMLSILWEDVEYRLIEIEAERRKAS